jgi:hypothetical protein
MSAVENRTLSPPTPAKAEETFWLQCEGGFVIVAPPFVANSAGVGCLYRLCHELRSLGFQAVVAVVAGGGQTAPGLDTPMIDLTLARVLCDRGFTAIYPETVPGNPLAAASVIRWVLNRPGLLGGDAVYSDDEHVFYYSEVFRPYIQNRIAGKLYMPTIDESIFYADENVSSRRSLECFYVGKSVWRDGVIDGDRMFEITREFPAKAELGKLFRAARVLYCFDNSTILAYEALLCGCPVVVIPDGTQSRQDYENLEIGMDGIAWGIEEHRGEPVDLPGLRDRYARVKRDFGQQLRQLVRVSGQRPASRVAAPPPRMAQQTGASDPSFDAPPACEVERVSLLRGLERTLRQWRKSWQRRRRERRKEHRFLRELIAADARGVFAEDSPTHRSLACFHIGQAIWRDGVVDRSKTYEVTITARTTLRNLVNLFRCSTVLYCFDRRSPIAQIALLSGCPVVLVGVGGRQRLMPAAATAGRHGGWLRDPRSAAVQRPISSRSDAA